jgi:hypothetical protein
MVEVGEGGNLLFASQVEPCWQCQGSRMDDYGWYLTAEVVKGRGLPSSSV